MAIKYTKQGNKIVARDIDTNLPAETSKGQTMAATPPTNELSWRKFVAKMTDGGKNILMDQLNLAAGNTIIVHMKDGTTQELIPTVNDIVSTRKDILDRLHGKSVTEVDLIKAEGQALAYNVYEQLTDDQLKLLVENKAILLPTGEFRLLSAGSEDE